MPSQGLLPTHYAIVASKGKGLTRSHRVYYRTTKTEAVKFARAKRRKGYEVCIWPPRKGSVKF